MPTWESSSLNSPPPAIPNWKTEVLPKSTSKRPQVQLHENGLCEIMHPFVCVCVCSKIYLKFTIFAILSVVSSVALSTIDPWTTHIWTAWVHAYVDFFQQTRWKDFWRFATIWTNSQMSCTAWKYGKNFKELGMSQMHKIYADTTWTHIQTDCKKLQFFKTRHHS